jgi:sortase A
MAGSAWSVVGCGRQQEASAAAEATPTATAVASNAASGGNGAAPLVAPPLAAKPNPINEGATHLPNRIEIPAIEVDVPVVELGWSQSEQAGQIFSEWDVAAYAAGWHINSAIPGAGGNVVLSGHNNVLGAVFRELDQLKKGDPITVWMNNRLYHYAVEQVIVLPDKGISDEQRVANTRWISPFDEERLTLVSCWPRNNNTHRIVVVALPQQVARASQ